MEKLNKIKDKALAFKNGETDLCKLMYLIKIINLKQICWIMAK